MINVAVERKLEKMRKVITSVSGDNSNDKNESINNNNIYE